jgi:hypothetical protein
MIHLLLIIESMFIEAKMRLNELDVYSYLSCIFLLTYSLLNMGISILNFLTFIILLLLKAMFLNNGEADNKLVFKNY